MSSTMSPQASPRGQRRSSGANNESPIIAPTEDRLPPELVDPTNADKMAIDTVDEPAARDPIRDRPLVKTPEPRLHAQDKAPTHRNSNNIAERSPSTPGHLAPFDWEDFQARYRDTLAEASQQEQDLLREFNGLVKVSCHLSCRATEPVADFS